MERAGPGLLLRDIVKGKDPQIAGVTKAIAKVAPDILLLTAFDFDVGHHALRAFADRLRESGLDYPYLFTLRPNTGVPTGLDLNGDGYVNDAEDKQGFAEFSGQGGMALLSKFPIAAEGATDFTSLMWADYAAMAGTSDRLAVPLPPNSEGILRLSSNGHWDVPVNMADGTVLRILAFHAGTPAFDTDLGTNAARNRDEVEFWRHYLNQDLPFDAPKERFVLMGDANLDSFDGQGFRETIASLLEHPKLQDPMPTSAGAVAASHSQQGANAIQTGDPALDTADWPDDIGPGNLRVDYVLPSVDLQVVDAGVHWPIAQSPDDNIETMTGSRHALVWADIRW